MNKFSKPKEVNGLDLAFGGDMKKLLPAIHEIPEDFREEKTEWNRMVEQWFYGGLKSFDSVPKEGVDKGAAIKHMSAILKSFEPKHEHKMSGCAYLLSLWFVEPKYTAK